MFNRQIIFVVHKFFWEKFEMHLSTKTIRELWNDFELFAERLTMLRHWKGGCGADLFLSYHQSMGSLSKQGYIYLTYHF